MFYQKGVIQDHRQGSVPPRRVQGLKRKSKLETLLTNYRAREYAWTV